LSGKVYTYLQYSKNIAPGARVAQRCHAGVTIGRYHEYWGSDANDFE